MTKINNTISLESYWMPFTANRQFKASPRILSAAKGMYYTDIDGNKVLDGTAGLWCVNAGHGRDEITNAVQHQLATLDYAPGFQMSHPIVHEFSNRLVEMSPGGKNSGLNHVFFANSGSEADDTALKIAIAYQRAIGQGTRTHLVGREKGYHGVGFGGISVGGLVNNRRVFPQIPASHMRHTLNIEKNAFTRGLPQHGAELADDLERIVALNGAETIAAVIVEPMSGSAGVILPPVGYLKRLREITRKYGILLIFDEVITGFGRLGTPFAVDYFGVVPDMVTCAKGLTNGAVPMAAVFVQENIYNALMQGPESQIELFHGYTYSGHPVACAAGLATMDIYKREGLLTRGKELEKYWEDALFSLKGLTNVIDIRTIGLVGGVELAPCAGAAGQRGYEIFVDCFKNGALVRQTGDIIALSPPLIVEKDQIDVIVSKLADAIKRTK
ncbi:beta-alanine--pyruvate transaminase [Bartonella apis]|uniref:aspartate aminotransferase family protein n=1 Tax=Bartonella apis TaxID=1686310 RepID=UPI000966DB46|nr:aspartate aminotransferase family protein [Bartonella apis]OLY45708.1 beta-alanine--pyruvate transaminase [Bartonella apis]